MILGDQFFDEDNEEEYTNRVPLPTDIGCGYTAAGEAYDEESDTNLIMMGEDDEEADDLNFKGYYAEKAAGGEGEEAEKYFDEETGAHFEFFDMVDRLKVLKEKRIQIDKAIEVENR